MNGHEVRAIDPAEAERLAAEVETRVEAAIKAEIKAILADLLLEGFFYAGHSAMSGEFQITAGPGLGPIVTTGFSPGGTEITQAKPATKKGQPGKPHFGNDRPWLGKTKGRS